MIMNLIVIVFVLGVAYAWMIRGMFNSLIHLLCVVVAGAIAFAFWETLAMMLIGMSPERGFLSFLESVAWGVSLIVPFIVSLLALRFATDKLIASGIKNAMPIDYAGGGICGLVTGVLSAGILVIGIGTMRLPNDFLGYQPLNYTENRTQGAGSLVRANGLWIPVDSITSKVYSQLSIGTMSTNEPLKKWYPELELVGMSTRITQDGAGRNAISPDDFTVKSQYIVGNENGSTPIAELLSDINDSKAQKYMDINGDPVSTGYLAGYVIEFEPGAKERGKTGGQLIVSNGQYRLLIKNDNDGSTMSVFAVAIISESSESNQYGRWRFDASDLSITSVGAKSSVSMAFEYVIPQGYTPIALFARSIRVNLDTLTDPVKYETVAQRDSIVRNGEILKGEAGSRQLDTSKALAFDPDDSENRMVRKNLSVTQQMSTQVARRGFTINEDNHIVDGEGIFDIKKEVGRGNAPVSKKLRVEKFSIGKGQTLIKVDVGIESAIGLFSEAASEAPTDEAFMLIDDQGNEYEAIGFEYSDSKIYHVRYTGGSTLEGLSDIPTLSRSQDKQKMNLLFLVSSEINIEYFTIGNIAIGHMTPPLDVGR